MVRVRVKLFALAKDLAGSDHLELDLADGATVGDVRAALGAACPDLMPLLPQVLIAVDAQYSEESQPVAPANEIACIPPVSGGGITIDTTSRLP
jgi:molybdopterin converting factor small subunit